MLQLAAFTGAPAVLPARPAPAQSPESEKCERGHGQRPGRRASRTRQALGAGAHEEEHAFSSSPFAGTLQAPFSQTVPYGLPTSALGKAAGFAKRPIDPGRAQGIIAGHEAYIHFQESLLLRLLRPPANQAAAAIPADLLAIEGLEGLQPNPARAADVVVPVAGAHLELSSAQLPAASEAPQSSQLGAGAEIARNESPSSVEGDCEPARAGALPCHDIDALSARFSAMSMSEPPAPASPSRSDSIGSLVDFGEEGVPLPLPWPPASPSAGSEPSVRLAPSAIRACELKTDGRPVTPKGPLLTAGAPGSAPFAASAFKQPPPAPQRQPGAGRAPRQQQQQKKKSLGARKRQGGDPLAAQKLIKKDRAEIARRGHETRRLRAAQDPGYANRLHKNRVDGSRRAVETRRRRDPSELARNLEKATFPPGPAGGAPAAPSDAPQARAAKAGCGSDADADPGSE
eukprot:tig00021374_g21118.t1